MPPPECEPPLYELPDECEPPLYELPPPYELRELLPLYEDELLLRVGEALLRVDVPLLRVDWVLVLVDAPVDVRTVDEAPLRPMAPPLLDVLTGVGE